MARKAKTKKNADEELKQEKDLKDKMKVLETLETSIKNIKEKVVNFSTNNDTIQANL